MHFFYRISLGLAHHKDTVVEVEMFTSRTPGMEIPGGSRVFGMTKGSQPEWFTECGRLVGGRVPGEILDRLPVSKDASPVFLRGTGERNRQALFILCYTQDDAVESAIRKGVFVKEDYPYEPGRIWERLRKYQKHLAKV